MGSAKVMDIETPLAEAKGFASPKFAEQNEVLPLPVELLDVFDEVLTLSLNEGRCTIPLTGPPTEWFLNRPSTAAILSDCSCEPPVKELEARHLAGTIEEGSEVFGDVVVEEVTKRSKRFAPSFEYASFVVVKALQW